MRRTIPRRLENPLRRALLYGSALLLLVVGWRIHERLEGRAALADSAVEAPEELSGRLGRRPLYDALVAAGVSAETASASARALSRRLNLRRMSGRDSFRVVRSTAGEFEHLTLIHGLERHVVTREPGGRMRAAVHPVPVITETHRARGTVEDNLWLAMDSQGVPAEVIMLFTDVFQWTLDFLTETRKGDRFGVVWTVRRTPYGRVLGRTIEAGAYSGVVAGKQVGVLFDGGYYDLEGDSLRRMFLKAPLKYRRISSRFSRSRRHPILRINRPHHGTDYAAPPGTPVSSVADGTVLAAKRNGGLGRMVKIRHNKTFTTVYGHLSRYGRGIRAGRRVRQGQVIGYVGSTGLARGAHLHFEIAKNGRRVDFLRLNVPMAKSVPRGRRAAFRERVEGLLADLGLERPARYAAAGSR